MKNIVIIIFLLSFPVYSQQLWLPFLESSQKPPETNLLQSNNQEVTFTIGINGMLSGDKFFNNQKYQRLAIPDGERFQEAGFPEVPVISKLIAVPDCDEVIISVTPSHELDFPDYYVIPAPRYESKKLPDGSYCMEQVFEENKSVYATDAYFPAKYGEIIETGYVRAQKVVRVAIYPVQFNPVRKKLKAFTDFQINLSFINPTSPINNELGIFRNMMHHVALNYELSGISASTNAFDPIFGNKLGKTSMVTSGSVNRVTNLNLLTDPTNPMPVDYLIITHSDLFNSTNLTNLANHRKDYNGFDVVIVKVNDIYNNPKYPSTLTTRYISIRDFIADVYSHGKANRTYDGKLGYIVLIGDAFKDDNVIEMVPASYAYNTYPDPDIPNEYLDHASDYYYSCVTETGGSYDDNQDLMYGRISVGNESALSNVVNKTINYEKYTSGTWRNNLAFMSFSPWFFNDDAHCDQEFRGMAQDVPQSYYISYAWRGFAADTEPDNGRPNFLHHPVDQVSQVLPYEADEMWFRRYTGWRWGYAPNYQYGGQYEDPNNLCGADLINTWLYDKINSGQHTFVYEGHGRQGSLGASEGSGRTIFRVDELATRLSNNGKYPFIIANACETGHFDAKTADLGSVDCLAEVAVNLQNEGAIGFLGSSRASYTESFGFVDRFILQAEFNSLSHEMGEAVMESKLRLFDLLFRRQYNLFGDPAINLWPYGYTLTEDLTLSGTVDISANITVLPGVTLTIQPGTTLIFYPGKSLTIQGTLLAQGNSSNHIRFTSRPHNHQKGDWEHIKFNNTIAQQVSSNIVISSLLR
jgi:hypothetical protein